MNYYVINTISIIFAIIAIVILYKAGCKIILNSSKKKLFKRYPGYKVMHDDILDFLKNKPEEVAKKFTLSYQYNRETYVFQYKKIYFSSGWHCSDTTDGHVVKSYSLKYDGKYLETHLFWAEEDLKYILNSIVTPAWNKVKHLVKKPKRIKTTADMFSDKIMNDLSTCQQSDDMLSFSNIEL